MKIHLANQSSQKLGGGWTFLNTFEKYVKRTDTVICGLDDCDVVFISGATMVSRDDVQAWKRRGKKIVLRIDNIPRNSRNRNTGTSRLYDFASLADLVIYQSEWARNYIAPFVKKNGPVILNGADTEIFNLLGDARPRDGKPQYMFAQYSKDETKRWHEAWYEYILAQRIHQNAHLWLVGRFSKDHMVYNFDFFQGEKYDYLGVMETPEEMAELYRSTDVLLLPYYNDACSNTLIEYRQCNPDGKIHHNETGGTPEIMKAPLTTLTAEYMTNRYLEEITKIL